MTAAPHVRPFLSRAEAGNLTPLNDTIARAHAAPPSARTHAAALVHELPPERMSRRDIWIWLDARTGCQRSAAAIDALTDECIRLRSPWYPGLAPAAGVAFVEGVAAATFARGGGALALLSALLIPWAFFGLFLLATLTPDFGEAPE